MLQQNCGGAQSCNTSNAPGCMQILATDNTPPPTGNSVSGTWDCVTIDNQVPDTTYQGTLAFNNPLPSTGGKDGDTVQEIRENSLRAFNEQGRAVTLQDYNVRAQSLPARLGTVAKTFVTKDEATATEANTNFVSDNPFSLSLYVLSYDNNKKLSYSTDNLKRNLKNLNYTLINLKKLSFLYQNFPVQQHKGVLLLSIEKMILKQKMY